MGRLQALGKDGYAGEGLGYLDDTQTQALEAYLRAHVYLTVQDIAAYVQECFRVGYTVSAMPDLLAAPPVYLYPAEQSRID